MARKLHTNTFAGGKHEMYTNKRWFKLGSFLLISLLVLPFTGMADIQKVNYKAEDQYERAERAADVLQELTRTPEKGIPRELLDGAQGIAVIPHVLKGAFVIGGSWGKGLISVRQRNGAWGTPIYVDITGGSFGFQIGGSATDLVLVFRNRRGVESLLSSKLKLGADASVAAGPVGRSAQASTDVKLNAEILSYSRSKGAFIGVALDGAVLSLDNSANEKVYGMSGKQVIDNPRISSPATKPFSAALRQYSPAAIVK
jgi:lipid-binding SYLF domain-containing protein